MWISRVIWLSQSRLSDEVNIKDVPVKRQKTIILTTKYHTEQQSIILLDNSRFALLFSIQRSG